MTEKELKWRKSLSKYRITGIVFSVSGLAVMLAGFIFEKLSNILYPFGGALVFVGMVFIIMATFFLKQKNSYKKAVAENDERNQLLYAKAGALAWQLTVSLATVVAGVLMCCNVDEVPTNSISLVLISGLFLHRVIFFVMKKY